MCSTLSTVVRTKPSGREVKGFAENLDPRIALAKAERRRVRHHGTSNNLKHGSSVMTIYLFEKVGPTSEGSTPIFLWLSCRALRRGKLFRSKEIHDTISNDHGNILV